MSETNIHDLPKESPHNPYSPHRHERSGGAAGSVVRLGSTVTLAAALAAGVALPNGATGDALRPRDTTPRAEALVPMTLEYELTHVYQQPHIASAVDTGKVGDTGGGYGEIALDVDLGVDPKVMGDKISPTFHTRKFGNLSTLRTGGIWAEYVYKTKNGELVHQPVMMGRTDDGKVSLQPGLYNYPADTTATRQYDVYVSAHGKDPSDPSKVVQVTYPMGHVDVTATQKGIQDIAVSPADASLPPYVLEQIASEQQ